MRDVEEAGRALFRSAENLRRSTSDLDAMMAYLCDTLENRKVDLGKTVHAKKEDDKYAGSWVTSIRTRNLRILEEAEGKPGLESPLDKPETLGTVTFALRLCGTEEAEELKPDWPWLDQACLLISWHKEEEFWYAEHFEPSQAQYIHPLNDRIWVWRDEETDYAHFFVIPLFALDTEKALTDHVLKPLKTLFEDGPSADAFPADSPVLFTTPPFARPPAS